ncbi:replication factor C subunit 1-like isoform X2 [Pocillopora verrucosa]|uniref:replication factor C subunit 1-like isoform X2 n=1 Tax=Pocillopora verrucosa TaxID=203993 RepID=UPI003340331D
MGEKKKEEKMGMSTITQQSNHQRKERKTSQNQSLRLQSLPLRRKRKYQRQLLLANWLPKLPQFQKLQLETQNQIQRKLLLQKRIKIDVCEETQIKGTPKVSKSEKVVEVSPSLEKKKSGYHSFMARDGPRALGSKEILQRAENYLDGLTVAIKGILESIERVEAADLIQRCGEKVTQSVNKKTSYVVVGGDPGESKLSKGDKSNMRKLMNWRRDWGKKLKELSL